VSVRFAPRHAVSRFVTGSYILHTGLDKWRAGEDLARGVHASASNAYPVFKQVEPEQFIKLLAVGEMATGAVLLTPFIPNRVAGAMLTGFSGLLLGMYARNPALRREGSIWPSQTGVAVSKDSWLLAIGLDLLLDSGRRS
jgi:hypothetical protein